jgi:hypothetical protein
VSCLSIRTIPLSLTVGSVSGSEYESDNRESDSFRTPVSSVLVWFAVATRVVSTRFARATTVDSFWLPHPRWIDAESTLISTDAGYRVKVRIRDPSCLND